MIKIRKNPHKTLLEKTKLWTESKASIKLTTKKK